MNDDLKKIAQKVLSKVPDAPDKFGSIIAILMIISISLTIIRIIQECNKNKLNLLINKKERCSFYADEIKNLSLSKTWFTKRTIKKLLKRELSKEEYDNYGISLMNALLNTGRELTEQETLTLMEAANV